MNFLTEQIELLWIVPVIALVLFIFIIQFIAQKKEQTGLSREVEQFNNGSLPMHLQVNDAGSERLTQLEKAISTITDSLTAQQQTLNQFSKGSIDYSGEINNLKAKLRELYKEYDMVLSENYSLKAKVKKLQGSGRDSASDAEKNTENGTVVSASMVESISKIDVLFPSKVDLKLFEDTRSLNIAFLDDTAEIDLSDLPRRSS